MAFRLSSDQPTIPWHRRLETRVAAAIALLIAVAIGAVFLTTIRAVTDRSLTRGEEDMSVARAAFNRLVESRAASAAAQVRLITELPIFRAYMGDSPAATDLASIRTMADQYRGQLGAEFSIVTDRAGMWTATPGWRDGSAPAIQLEAAIRSALAGQPQSTMAVVDDRVFLLVSAPARFADEILGSMTVGFALDDALARELAEVTQCDVSLVAGTNLAASSIKDTGRVQLARLLEGADALTPTGGPATLQQLGPRTYLIGAFPLGSTPDAASAGRLLLLRDWGPTQEFIDQLQRQFARAGLTVFASALICGLIFSRRMSRPFRDIASAARDISTAGNWSRQVPLRGSAEAMTMASAFNEMSTTLRHWYEEAQAKSAHLEASYERFHSVTESARDAIVSADEGGAIVFWNRSAQVIFGHEEMEILGRPLSNLIAEQDRQTFVDELALLSHQEAGGAGGRILEMTGLRRDGRTFPMELSAWQPDEQTHLTAIIRDITERRQAEDALKQRDERLQQAQKMEAIGRLAGGVAHDFNNLLTAIIGFSGLIRDNLKAEDPLRADVEEVLAAADRAATLTRQLLAFSRRQVVAPQVVALDRIVAGTEKMLRRLIGEDIVLSSVTAPKLGRVRADPGQIEQVLINLSINARDAMPDGGELRIELFNAEVDATAAAARPEFTPGRYVCLSVSDNGSGIAPDIVSHIFEPFFTTKEEGKGTGLGLATVYGIAKQNQGYVDVDSSVGSGTTFRVYFPRVEAAELPLAPGTPEITQTASETVLLVEDDDRVRGLLASVLRKRGYTILEASRGDQALELAQVHTAPIHLLLSDIVMPGMSGRVVAARVTELRPETRVLLMSGYSDDAVLRSGIEASKTPFIQKPFSMDALAAKIREALGGPMAN